MNLTKNDRLKQVTSDTLIVGCEPTSYYWLTFRKFLHEHDIQLVKDGRYSTSYLPSGVYAEVREAFVCRDQIMKQHVRLSNQIQGWLQKFFLEYFECYADWDSSSRWCRKFLQGMK